VTSPWALSHSLQHRWRSPEPATTRQLDQRRRSIGRQATYVNGLRGLSSIKNPHRWGRGLRYGRVVRLTGAYRAQKPSILQFGHRIHRQSARYFVADQQQHLAIGAVFSRDKDNALGA
jgi:hypothetical protein